MRKEVLMSGECDKCGERCLDCRCHWSETEIGNQQFLDIINENLFFSKEDTLYCRECKNESLACVCL